MNYLEIQKQKKTLKIKIKKWKKGKNNIIAKRAIILFFLFIIFIFVFLGYLIHTSKIGIEIDNFIFDSEKQEKINKDSKIYVYLLLLNKMSQKIEYGRGVSRRRALAFMAGPAQRRWRARYNDANKYCFPGSAKPIGDGNCKSIGAFLCCRQNLPQSRLESAVSSPAPIDLR